jgi:hypothetical protein
MRHDKRAYLAVTLLATFMGSAAVAAPGPAFSNRLNADSSLRGPWSAGVQLAVIFGPTASEPALQSAERTPKLTLVKKKKASAAEVCAAKCDKAYRRCYSQGNKAGTPEVQGGQPCQEQKDMCLRACPQ